MQVRSDLASVLLLIGIASVACQPSPPPSDDAGNGDASETSGSSPAETGESGEEEVPGQTTSSSTGSTGGTSTSTSSTSSDGSDASTTSPGTTTTVEETTGGADETGSDAEGALAMRTQCPEAPPAGPIADPVQDVYNLTVPRETYVPLFQQMEPFQGSRGTLPWHIYEPEQASANPDDRFPLLVVLHGGRGRELADGNLSVDVLPYLVGSSNGLLTDAHRQQYPVYILAPHCIEDEGCVFGTNEWASVGGAFYQVQPEPSVAGGTALELIEHVAETYAVDRTRIYVTGNSMGGGGTWEFVQRRPDLFAAGVTVSGHVPSLSDLDVLAASKVPVWAFTGADDNVNSDEDTDQAVAHLTSQGGCAWITKYANTGHVDVLWANPYLDAGLWPWLFAQKIPTVGEPGAGDPFPTE